MILLKDVYNLECKIFEPATADLSQKEIKVLLKQLYECFPYTDKGEENKEPYETSNDYSKKWFQAYNHLLMILEMRKQESKHNLSIWLSIIAIVVSVIGVAVRFSTKI